MSIEYAVSGADVPAVTDSTKVSETIPIGLHFKKGKGKEPAIEVCPFISLN